MNIFRRLKKGAGNALSNLPPRPRDRLLLLYDKLRDELPIVNWEGRPQLEEALKGELSILEAEIFEKSELPLVNSDRLIYLAANRNAIIALLDFFGDAQKHAKNLNDEITRSEDAVARAIDRGIAVDLN